MTSRERKESDYSFTVLDYIEKYQNRVFKSNEVNSKEIYDFNRIYFGYLPLNSKFDQFSKQLFDSLSPADNDLEFLFSLLYSEKVNEFYYELQETKYENLKVSQEYKRKVNRINDLIDLHYAITLGGFIQTSNAKLLGNHISLGGDAGFKNKRFTYDLIMKMRFGGAKEEYQLIKEQDTVNTDYYLGVHIGLRASCHVWRNKKNEILVFGGFGVNGFDTETLSNNKEVFSANSANLNGGLNYRYYYSYQNYIGFSYQYNIVNYNSEEILTNLDGNFHTFSLSIGVLANEPKRRQLNELYYRGNYYNSFF